MRTTVAEVLGVRPPGEVPHDGVAVFSLSFRRAQAAAGTACGGTALPRQLLLDRQGATRSRLPAAVYHRAGHGRVSAVLRRPLPRDEGCPAGVGARVTGPTNVPYRSKFRQFFERYGTFAPGLRQLRQR